MVTKYGMSTALGPINYGSDRDEVFIGRTMGQAKGYSEDIAAGIDREIKAFVDEAYRRCEEILNQRSRELELTAQYLLEFETMPAEDFALVFGPVEELEARKEAIRFQRQEKARKDDEERARLQAERDAETARRLRAADEALHGKKPQNPGNPDPF